MASGTSRRGLQKQDWKAVPEWKVVVVFVSSFLVIKGLISVSCHIAVAPSVSSVRPWGPRASSCSLLVR